MTTEQITEKQYREEIKSLAREALKIKDTDERAEWMAETVDGHQWVIYTFYNLGVLQWTDNREATWEIYGDESLDGCNSYGELTMRLAYFSMSQDLQDMVSRLGE